MAGQIDGSTGGSGVKEKSRGQGTGQSLKSLIFSSSIIWNAGYF
jgi:hypothetical protein